MVDALLVAIWPKDGAANYSGEWFPTNGPKPQTIDWIIIKLSTIIIFINFIALPIIIIIISVLAQNQITIIIFLQ